MPQNKFESIGHSSEGERDEDSENQSSSEKEVSKEEEKKEKEYSPIQENAESVSYLGVRLEKAEVSDSERVEPRERYNDYINYRYALELQQKIAVSFKEGEPILLEGGTSLGKTTTIRKMASELGYEVHYINLNGQTDVENLMGRYITNPNKRSSDDPEYVFAEGEITQGLRREEGRKKIIVLDEINAAHPAILKRLNEVMDSLGKDGEVTLTEDASERVSTSKEDTKIVGLMNPPGEGYEGVNPISKELIRRWNYQKEPSELPMEAFSYLRKARRGKLPREEQLPREVFLCSNEGKFNIEKLNEIPGYEQIEEQFEEFHFASKKLLQERVVAEDQPQEILFDDHEELRRFQQFVFRYYEGDVTDTAKRALRFYYSGKIQDQKDKEKIEELINHIKYTPPSDSRRRGVTEEEEEKPRTGETKTEREKFLEQFEEKSLDYMGMLLEEGADKDDIAEGLAGLDSERAWEMRERLLEEGADKDYIAEGLAGVDSEKAWEMRERLLEEGVGKGWVTQGLAGIDSERAWEMRERLLEEGVDKNSIAHGLAGVDSEKAWEMRKKFFEEGVDKGSIAQGLVGDYITSVWRYQEEKREAKTEREKFLEQFEEKSLDYMEKLLNTGANKDRVAQGLAGLDSERAWEMREKLIKEGASKKWVTEGLAGLDSEKAWEMREWLIKHEEDSKNYIARGLAGVDSERAWEMREKLLDEKIEKGQIVIGLAGLDSERAWEMREKLWEDGANKAFIVIGLTGLDSERAWEMRERLLEDNVDKGSVAQGLAGLDSERAWEMREWLIKHEEDSKNYIARGLAGVDSERAWDMRERLLRDGADKGWVASSLAGLDSKRAWEMREKLSKEGADKGWIAQGVSGICITFARRYQEEK